MANRHEDLLALSSAFPGARIAMEVGTHSPWISRLLEEAGHEVLVANARKLRAIYTNDRKCDELDARMLARLGRVDPNLLHPIRHGSEQSQRDLVLIKMRSSLVKRRVDLISSIRCSLKSLGVRLPSPSTPCFAKAARATLRHEEPELLASIEPCLASLDALTESIRAYDCKIAEAAQSRHPVTEVLRQVAGVGPVTALCFVLTIEDPRRFARTRDVGAYLGLTPRRDQSGGTERELPITKAGNRQLRTLLVQAAQYIMGNFGPDCELRRFGESLVARGGKAAKKRAVIAVARKLAVLLLALWKTKGPYEPFHREEPA